MESWRESSICRYYTSLDRGRSCIKELFQYMEECNKHKKQKETLTV